jgi:ferrous iron transport protein B
VYLVLIGLAVPAVKVGGVLSAQTLVFGSMYALGVMAALLSGWAMKKWLRTREPSFLAIELPEYRMPHWKNVFYTLYEKVSSFVFGAGKIILIVSLVLWFMASFGPPKKMKEAEAVAIIESSLQNYNAEQTDLYVASKKLENSYAGYTGRLIEPLIRPLGFDWKIGIALITSFAAREVFVGTISTLYSIGKSEKSQTIKDKLTREVNPETGKPVFTMAVSLSLLLFYLFAMQCMSTLATVYRETRSWKWPAIQFLYMSVLAYSASLLAFQLFK